MAEQEAGFKGKHQRSKGKCESHGETKCADTLGREAVCTLLAVSVGTQPEQSVHSPVNYDLTFSLSLLSSETAVDCHTTVAQLCPFEKPATHCPR